MKLVVMTRPTFFVEEDKILATLFDEGMDNLHLYKEDPSPVYSERLLSLLPEDCHRRITVHEHFYLKAEYDLCGIHLDSVDAEVPNGYKGNFSRTCRDLDDLKMAKKKARYVFLANVFDSHNDSASFSMEQLREASRRGLIDKHVYACGGVNMDNARIAKDLGFGGVVVRSDLWNRFDIHNERDYKEVINYFVKMRKTVG